MDGQNSHNNFEGNESLKNKARSCPICNKEESINTCKSLYGFSVCSGCYKKFANLRNFAFIIDITLWLSFVFVVIVIFGRQGLFTNINAEEYELLYTDLWYLSLLIFCFKDGFSGHSPGKAIMGIQTLNESNGTPAGFWRSFKRNLPIMIPVMPIIISSQLLKGHRTGDGWAKTKVIWKRYRNNPIFATSSCQGYSDFSTRAVEKYSGNSETYNEVHKGPKLLHFYSLSISVILVALAIGSYFLFILPTIKKEANALEREKIKANNNEVKERPKSVNSDQRLNNLLESDDSDRELSSLLAKNTASEDTFFNDTMKGWDKIEQGLYKEDVIRLLGQPVETPTAFVGRNGEKWLYEEWLYNYDSSITFENNCIIAFRKPKNGSDRELSDSMKGWDKIEQGLYKEDVIRLLGQPIEIPTALVGRRNIEEWLYNYDSSITFKNNCIIAFRKPKNGSDRELSDSMKGWDKIEKGLYKEDVIRLLGQPVEIPTAFVGRNREEWLYNYDSSITFEGNCIIAFRKPKR